MALLNEVRLRELAKSRTSRAYDSISESLQKTIRASKARSEFDIFLSHSYLDRELMVGIMAYLEGLAYTVYVDWREDSQLSRDNVTKESAETVRARIGQSKSLFFATTAGAKDSRWMPWELGYMDGKKGRSAILPVTRYDTSSDEYDGQEYLGIYPYVSGGNNRSGQELLWVHENEETYVNFDAWLQGKQPHEHD